MTVDMITVSTERTTLDLLLWRFYRREVAGIVEDTLTRNLGLSDLGAFLPVGTVVQVARPAPATSTAKTTTVATLYD